MPALEQLRRSSSASRKGVEDEADKVEELLNNMLSLKKERYIRQLNRCNNFLILCDTRTALDRIMRAEEALQKVQRLLQREQSELTIEN